MKKRILIPTEKIRKGFEELEEKFEVVYAEYNREQLIENIADYDGIVSLFNNSFMIDKEVMEAAKGRLKIISNYGVGYDKVDCAAASELSIVVTNTPDPVTEPTAELAMGLMVDIARNISQTDRALRDRENPYFWSPTSSLGSTLWCKTLGIIGMGRIGKSLARRAKAFGMKVVYHNRHKLSTMDEWQFDAEYLSKEELLKVSDFVSLNAPATSETYRILDSKEFELMKPTSVLINTARGSLVNESALIEALTSGKIAAGALDVYEYGDGNISDGLIGLENVVLTPHIGTQTHETRIEISKYAAQNIILFFEGAEPLSKVN
ncbi:MAG: NAD(P)-dependent oxidoreductase [Rikenellaceae bacterium]